MAERGFAYVQARLQARHGALPAAADWQALEASHTPGQYLALARAGPLARWVDGLDDTADLHRTEQRLRAHWQRYVDEVAAWQPAAWQEAARWFARLPELPLASRETDVPAQPPAPATPPAAAWLARWLQLMPRAAAASTRMLQLRRIAAWLLPALAADRRGRAALPEPAQRALLQLFRRHAASPVAVFAHLALVALVVERLRGGIVTRVLFAGPRAAQGA